MATHKTIYTIDGHNFKNKIATYFYLQCKNQGVLNEFDVKVNKSFRILSGFRYGDEYVKPVKTKCDFAFYTKDGVLIACVFTKKLKTKGGVNYYKGINAKLLKYTFLHNYRKKQISFLPYLLSVSDKKTIEECIAIIKTAVSDEDVDNNNHDKFNG